MESEVNDSFLKEHLETETGKIIANKVKLYMYSNRFVKGFNSSLGDEGIEEIIENYKPERLGEIDASNALENADIILSIVRRLKLIKDVDFQLFMKRLRNSPDSEVNKLHDICYEIVKKKVDMLLGSKEEENDEGTMPNIDYDLIKSNHAIQKLSDLQKMVINFVDCENNVEEDFGNISQMIEDIKLKDDEDILRDFLMFLNTLTLYHYRNNNFMGKIEQLFVILKKSMLRFLTNCEMIKIFRKNKRILLLLCKEKFFCFNNKILVSFLSRDTCCYLNPEISEVVEEEIYDEYLGNNIQEMQEDIFYEIKRENGENDNHICEIIRRDDIDEFKQKTKDIDLNSYIHCSIFETNQILLKEEISLIKYAAFFGSSNIFNYLRDNKVLIDFSILKYALHGRNTDMICLICELIKDREINGVENNEFKDLIETAFQCFENENLSYIISELNAFWNSDLEKFYLEYSLKYHNYIMSITDENLCSDRILRILTEYDCSIIIEDLLKEKYFECKKLHNMALNFSSYKVIQLIEVIKARDFTEKMNDNELQNIKNRIDEGKNEENMNNKIIIFNELFQQGLNTKEKYMEFIDNKPIDEKNDQYLKFILLKSEQKPDDEIAKKLESVKNAVQPPIPQPAPSMEQLTQQNQQQQQEIQQLRLLLAQQNQQQQQEIQQLRLLLAQQNKQQQKAQT